MNYFIVDMKFVIGLLLILGSCDYCLLKIAKETHPRVITPLGTIEGFYDTSFGGRKYEAYKGIPFAQPPIGNLRFEVPKSISPWTGILMAKHFAPPCMHYNFLEPENIDTLLGAEDCLYLNVYTTIADENRGVVNAQSSNLLPVLVYIFGGSFVFGTGNQYGPKYLLDRNVTLVTFHYRLGPLGFLSTEDEIVPGNMGMKDQVMALRWVKDNIEYFGGDPSRITIFGHSSGGGCVHYHYLTNLTAGLFQGGMSISGTALNPWALIDNPLEKAKRLAVIVGCPSDDNQDMVNCFRNRPAHQLINGIRDFMAGVFNPASGWGPTLEKGGGNFTFIDRRPIDIVGSGNVHDVPWITGVVKDESLFPMSYYKRDQKYFDILNADWEILAPYMLHYNETIPRTNHTKIAKLIKQHYLGESPFGKQTFNESVQMLSAREFFYSFQNAVKLQAQVNRSPVYTYYFTYRGAHSYSEEMSGSSENVGVSHVDDVSYILDAFIDPTTTAEDLDMQRVLIDLLVSFATHGTPDVGVEWPRFNDSCTNDLIHYLHIAGPKNMRMESASNFGDINFWRSIASYENVTQPRNFCENKQS